MLGNTDSCQQYHFQVCYVGNRRNLLTVFDKKYEGSVFIIHPIELQKFFFPTKQNEIAHRINSIALVLFDPNNKAIALYLQPEDKKALKNDPLGNTLYQRISIEPEFTVNWATRHDYKLKNFTDKLPIEELSSMYTGYLNEYGEQILEEIPKRQGKLEELSQDGFGKKNGRFHFTDITLTPEGRFYRLAEKYIPNSIDSQTSSSIAPSQPIPRKEGWGHRQQKNPPLCYTKDRNYHGKSITDSYYDESFIRQVQQNQESTEDGPQGSPPKSTPYQPQFGFNNGLEVSYIPSPPIPQFTTTTTNSQTTNSNVENSSRKKKNKSWMKTKATIKSFF